MSLRFRDSNVENEIAMFLDEYFYPQNVTDFRRFTDKNNQLNGIDVRFSIPELGLVDIIVDEKAQTHYVNKDLPTFAFELSFLNSKGEVIGGWLLDENKSTQYYMLIWVWASREWNVKKSDITRLECLLIERAAIIKYLEDSGYGISKLNELDHSIRNEGTDGVINKTNDSDIYFFSSKRLTEEPINVIIKRRKLVELATKRYIVKI